MQQPAWQTKSSKIVHQNPWYKIRQDTVIRPDGKPGTFNVIEDANAVFVIAITDENKIIFIKLFRYPTQMESWEIPAGGIEPGEDELTAAKRELQEETGMTARSWQNLGRIQVNNSKNTAIGTVFVCRDLKNGSDHEQAEEGITHMTEFTLDEVKAMIAGDEITDASTLAPLLKYIVAS
ncbi:MAG TPA: NUDIX hydrolase [Candidatus Saccharimonadales bacterium]|jgi:8-oxo-dGTP pyrophosphatase MutT (NUDIX family)|nr:NUDIX hydrolase [Candidatus Saccharimonadales bacterium]